MRAELSHIVKIFSGAYLKSGITGSIHYLQSKHFEDGKFNADIMPELEADYKNMQYLLRSGDILLAIKGRQNFAFHYQDSIGRAIASPTFIIMRLSDSQNILPDYLAWYFNHPQTQLRLKNNARGTDIPSLTIGSLKDFEIDIPPIKKQKAILELEELRIKEKNLMAKIAAQYEKRAQQYLLQLAKQ